AGDNYLGGEDFDQLLLEHFVQAQQGNDFPGATTLLQPLRREAERVRRQLGQAQQADFVVRVEGREWRHVYTQDALADLFAPLLARLRTPIERALRDARIRASDLDEVLLTVYTVGDQQEQVLVKVFQGESRLVRDNVLLGVLEIPVPRRKAGEVALDVRFTYDINGILEAQVSIPLTGEQHALVIENNPGVLSPEEVRERLAALAELKTHPRDQQPNTLLLARLERLYQESLGEVRELIGA
uniref:Molecular chaperone HtpG n=1 Tax=Steinernema glaseri TaxID=37863 RepID=A0A1I7XX37_9BILA